MKTENEKNGLIMKKQEELARPACACMLCDIDRQQRRVQGAPLDLENIDDSHLSNRNTEPKRRFKKKTEYVMAGDIRPLLHVAEPGAES